MQLRRSVLRWLVLSAVAAAVGGACGGAASLAPVPSATATPEAGSPSPVATVAPSPSPAPMATPSTAPSPSALVDPAPRELQGTWLANDQPVRITLVIGPVTYRISRGPNTAVGNVAVTGDTVRLFGSSLCSGTGEYRWARDGDVLALTMIGTDPCPGRSDALVDINFTLVLGPP